MNQTIATPDVVIAHCIQWILLVEILRLIWLVAGGGHRIYDEPRPEPPDPIVIWDWASEGGWPA